MTESSRIKIDRRFLFLQRFFSYIAHIDCPHGPAFGRRHIGVRLNNNNKAIKNERFFFSLRMKVETSEVTNKLINESMLVDYELRYCEKQIRDSCIIQCFNCQKYEHIERTCRQNIKCDRCAESYITQKY